MVPSHFDSASTWFFLPISYLTSRHVGHINTPRSWNLPKAEQILRKNTQALHFPTLMGWKEHISQNGGRLTAESKYHKHSSIKKKSTKGKVGDGLHYKAHANDNLHSQKRSQPWDGHSRWAAFSPWPCTLGRITCYRCRATMGNTRAQAPRALHWASPWPCTLGPITCRRCRATTGSKCPPCTSSARHQGRNHPRR